MSLFQVSLDWFLTFLTLFGEMFYLWKIVKEERTVLMDMMKYLILNDVLCFPIILIHDVPSYFMSVSLSDRFYVLKELGIFAQCLPFFYGLLMLPIFALLNLLAIIAVHSFVTFKKRHISQAAIATCYVLSIALSVPLMTEYCGFNYDSSTHMWYFDMKKPYTGFYIVFNQSLQLVVLGVVGICMTIVICFLAKRAQRTSMSSLRNTNAITVVPGPTMSHGTHISQASSLTSQSQKVSHDKKVSPAAPVKTRAVTHRNRSILDQTFAFFVLCLCFTTATICFNYLYCSDTICIILTIVSGYGNRSKWLIYCFLMRREATLSRIFH